MLSYPKHNRIWCPSDAVTVPTAWWDATIPEALIPGTEPGVRVIRDWSGNGYHALQTTAADQGTVSTLGPNNDFTVTMDASNDGWQVQGSLGAATTRYLCVTPNMIGVAAIAQLFMIYVDATHYAICGHAAGGAMQFGDYPGGGFAYRVSSYSFDLGSAHSYGWALNAVAGTVTFYKDGIADPAGPLVYTPIAPTNLSIGYNVPGTAVSAAPINGALIRAAWYEGSVP